MTTVQIDLFNSSEGTIASAAADATFWTQYQASAEAFAAQYGYSVASTGEAPDPEAVSQNVNTWADYTAWVQTTAATTVGAKPPMAAQAMPATGGTVALIVIAVAGTAGLLWWLWSKRWTQAF
jgi:hypothetical protein